MTSLKNPNLISTSHGQAGSKSVGANSVTFPLEGTSPGGFSWFLTVNADTVNAGVINATDLNVDHIESKTIRNANWLETDSLTVSTASVTETLDASTANVSTNDLEVLGDSLVRGAGEFKETLTVDGFTQLQSTLSVSESANFQNTLSVLGTTDLFEDLVVEGDSYLKSKLEVGGESVLKDTLTVQGKTVIDNDLLVSTKITSPLIQSPEILTDDLIFEDKSGPPITLDKLRKKLPFFRSLPELASLPSQERVEAFILENPNNIWGENLPRRLSQLPQRIFDIATDGRWFYVGVVTEDHLGEIEVYQRTTKLVSGETIYELVRSLSLPGISGPDIIRLKLNLSVNTISVAVTDDISSHEYRTQVFSFELENFTLVKTLLVSNGFDDDFIIRDVVSSSVETYVLDGIRIYAQFDNFPLVQTTLVSGGITRGLTLLENGGKVALIKHTALGTSLLVYEHNLGVSLNLVANIPLPIQDRVEDMKYDGTYLYISFSNCVVKYRINVKINDYSLVFISSSLFSETITDNLLEVDDQFVYVVKPNSMCLVFDRHTLTFIGEYGFLVPSGFYSFTPTSVSSDGFKVFVAGMGKKTNSSESEPYVRHYLVPSGNRIFKNSSNSIYQKRISNIDDTKIHPIQPYYFSSFVRINVSVGGGVPRNITLSSDNRWIESYIANPTDNFITLKLRLPTPTSSVIGDNVTAFSEGSPVENANINCFNDGSNITIYFNYSENGSLKSLLDFHRGHILFNLKAIPYPNFTGIPSSP